LWEIELSCEKLSYLWRKCSSLVSYWEICRADLWETDVSFEEYRRLVRNVASKEYKKKKKIVASEEYKCLVRNVDQFWRNCSSLVRFWEMGRADMWETELSCEEKDTFWEIFRHIDNSAHRNRKFYKVLLEISPNS